MSESTTIAALATAPAPAGLAVVRVSGPKTRVVLRALFQAKHEPTEDPRRLCFGKLLDFKTGQILDTALAVYMPGPYSFTGEDVGEFQFHGSPILVEKVLRSLFAFGISPAEPGEFSKRAFLNGKMDLVQAESIAELINATNEAALTIAGEHLKGRFSTAIEQIGEPLRNILAEFEATIDFPEEEIAPESLEQLTTKLTTARERILALITTYSYGAVVREGFKVLICGRPNAGKSSLLNLLLNRERAIVSEVSGTTRDLLEEQCTIGGFTFVFCDSAGLLDNTTDKVEEIGMRLARGKIPWADLILFVADSTDEEKSYEALLNTIRPTAKKIWMVINKIDLNPRAIGSIFCDSAICAQNFYLSALKKEGLAPLMEALVDEVKQSLPSQSDANQIVINARHRDCLNRAEVALGRAAQAASQKLPTELISADLREALRALDELVGRTYTEDILGRIFSKFCIGK
jgi:tRNA modification GTPase